MAWFTRSSRFTLMAVALALGLAASLPTGVKAQLGASSLSSQIPNQWDFSPPSSPTGDPVPTNTDSGGIRGPGLGSCIADVGRGIQPIALVPPSTIGTTVAEYPTVFWYMPKTRAWGIEFTIRDSNNQPVYSTKYALGHRTEKTADNTNQFVIGTPGIMSLKVPAPSGFPALKVGEDYQWQLRLICDPTEIDRSNDIYIDGGFKRVQASPNLTRRLQQATPEERVAIYANERLWYETLETLVELRRERPGDKNLTDAWNKLLESVGINTIAEEPVFGDARIVN